MKEFEIVETTRCLTADEMKNHSVENGDFVTFTYDCDRHMYVYVFAKDDMQSSVKRKEDDESQIYAIGERTQKTEPMQQNIFGETTETQEKKFLPQKALINIGIDQQIAADYLTMRQAKKRPLTKTAFSRLRNQITTAEKEYGITANDIMMIVVNRGWESFSCDWLENIDLESYGIEKKQQKDYIGSRKWE